MPVHHTWQPITDLQAAPELLADDGLRTMLLVWQEQKDDIATPEEMRAFDAKLRREWAVHTGLIEGIYTLDRGVTEMLIERGIEEALIPHRPGQQLPEITAAIINDHKDVVDGLFDFVADRRQITTSYIKELHNALVQNQDTTTGVDKFGNRREVPLIKGDYKKYKNNPTRTDGKLHEYCPPEHVASEMDNLIKIHDDHVAKGFAPEVSAAWLHHRFTQIHPFQDGNGRVARCLATIIFLRARGFPLTIRNTNGERAKYIDALEAADGGNLQPLVSVFATSQRREFLKAIDVSSEILEESLQETSGNYQTRTERIAKSAALKITVRNEQNKEWIKAQHIAKQMRDTSLNMLEKTSATLEKSITSHTGAKAVFAADYLGKTATNPFATNWMDHNWGFSDINIQVSNVAKWQGYSANMQVYHDWVRLALQLDNNNSEIVVSFHGVGKEYRGVLFCSVFFLTRGAPMMNLAGATMPGLLNSPSKALTDEAFQINYQDSADSTQERFRPWLEKAIERGLTIWHKSL